MIFQDISITIHQNFRLILLTNDVNYRISQTLLSNVLVIQNNEIDKINFNELVSDLFTTKYHDHMDKIREVQDTSNLTQINNSYRSLISKLEVINVKKRIVLNNRFFDELQTPLDQLELLSDRLNKMNKKLLRQNSHIVTKKLFQSSLKNPNLKKQQKRNQRLINQI